MVVVSVHLFTDMFSALNVCSLLSILEFCFVCAYDNDDGDHTHPQSLNPSLLFLDGVCRDVGGSGHTLYIRTFVFIYCGVCVYVCGVFIYACDYCVVYVWVVCVWFFFNRGAYSS